MSIGCVNFKHFSNDWSVTVVTESNSFVSVTAFCVGDEEGAWMLLSLPSRAAIVIVTGWVSPLGLTNNFGCSQCWSDTDWSSSFSSFFAKIVLFDSCKNSFVGRRVNYFKFTWPKYPTYLPSNCCIFCFFCLTFSTNWIDYKQKFCISNRPVCEGSWRIT